jgi:hypothetical protein
MRTKFQAKNREGRCDLRDVLVDGTITHGNEPSGCIRVGECLDLLSNYQLLKKEYAPCS